MIPVECYFALSALLFFIGVYGFVTRRNLIAMLISVELVLNAVDSSWCSTPLTSISQPSTACSIPMAWRVCS